MKVAGMSLQRSPDLSVYQEIFRVSQDAIAVIDPNGCYIGQNEAHRLLLGYQDEELQHQTPAIHLGSEQFAEIVERLKAEGVYRGEVLSRTKTGECVPLDLCASRITNEVGETVAYVGIKRDISARKRYEFELKRRYDELHLIYDFTQTVVQARDVEEVYQAALSAIGHGLAADRASILLFDADGVMRFKAWRGLSHAYRAAVEGHSPWSPDAVSPTPITIEDVDTQTGLDGIREVIRAEGIRALGFFPLTFQGRLLGKFMVYFSAPHRFSTEETRLAQHIASHIAFSIMRKQAEQLQYQASQMLQGVIDASPLAIVAIDQSGKVILWNRSAENMFGWFSHEVIGQPPPHIPNDSRPEFEGFLRQAMTENRTMSLETKRTRRDGHVMDVAVHWAPLSNLDGTRLGVVGVISDITERKHAESERDRLVAELRSEHHKLLATQVELSERIEELESFEEVVVGRELKMIELEKEIERLRQLSSSAKLSEQR